LELPGEGGELVSEVGHLLIQLGDQDEHRIRVAPEMLGVLRPVQLPP
jgi:hypothetical protein